MAKFGRLNFTSLFTVGLFLVTVVCAGFISSAKAQIVQQSPSQSQDRSLQQERQIKLVSETSTILTYQVSWHNAEVASIDIDGLFGEAEFAKLTAGGPEISASLQLGSNANPQVRIVASQYDDLPIQLDQNLPDYLDTFLALPAVEVTAIGKFRHKWIGTLVVRPVQVQKSGNLRVFSSMTIEVTRAPVENTNFTRQISEVNADNSVLNSGTWFKVPIQQSGMYQIDRNYLTGLGVNPDNIDPNNVAVFGNGGRSLPVINSTPRPQDLVASPVWIEGGGDGRFDPADKIVFYAGGPRDWRYDEADGRWEHYVNAYTNISAVFIRLDDGANLPIESIDYPNVGSPTVLTSFDDHFFIEEDFANLGEDQGSGTDWIGRRVDSSIPQITVLDTTIAGRLAGTISYRSRIVTRSSPRATMIYEGNGGQLADIRPPSVNLGETAIGYYARSGTESFTDDVSAGQAVNLTLRLQSGGGDPQGWIDWLEVSYPRSFEAENDYLRFRTPAGVQVPYQIALKNFSTEPQVWDISDLTHPIRLAVQASGADFVIQTTSNSNESAELIAFVPTSNQIKSLQEAVPVQNQNLRGIQTWPEFVIVTPDTFKVYAEQLAARRRSEGLETEVVTVNQIYNEFSGGVADMRAMRDYFRFLYKRTTNEDQLLKYALLFGDGHFNYRNLNLGSTGSVNNNWILPYETQETFWRDASYTTDDYFGLLDDEEGEWKYTSAQSISSERVDIGIGRFVVQTVDEAEGMLNKIERYESADTYGSWRSNYTFVADDGPAGSNDDKDLHTWNADAVARLVAEIAPTITQKKIYGISYQVEVTAERRRIPGASADIKRALSDGTLIWTYSGHGGWEGLADEQLFTVDDIDQLDNIDNLAVFITATCSFGHWDFQDKQSGGERLLLNPNGGAIALFTTVRVVYTSSNTNTLNTGLNRALNGFLLTPDSDGEPIRFGDALLQTKNTTVGTEHNNRKFNLFGDPTMRIGLPRRQVKLLTVNDQNLDSVNVAVKALDQVEITGEVNGLQSNVRDESFNGFVELVVFDAERQIEVEGARYLPQDSYQIQNDLIYRGRAAVTNGHFSASFVVPRDIAYTNASGKISAYIFSSGDDGVGVTSNITVGGTSDNPITDTVGPEMELFLGDSTFVSGGLTANEPVLIVKLFDDNGINTVGAGVGHELLLVVDGDEANAIDVASAYVGDTGSFKSGEIQYTLPEQENGSHNLSVKAWDVVNNATTHELDYIVTASERLAIQRVYNYPNPMSDETEFVFEHNQPAGTPASVEIRIFTLSGRLVTRLITEDVLPSGTLPAGLVKIPWNGLDKNFDNLASGVYLYHLRLTVDTESGGSQSAEEVQKLAIIH